MTGSKTGSRSELAAGAPVANLLTGLGVDEYFARTDIVGSQYFLTDALGSTVALTDASGATLNDYTYEPFGNVSITGAVFNPYQYTGRENDGTGLYYYRARYYSPTLQRFISEDPIGLQGGLGLYTYVENNPLSFTDPSGLDVTISLYPCCAGFNHVGIGVNTSQTVGFRPVHPNAPVDTGEVTPDQGPVIDTITIPTTPEQDQAIQDYITRRQRNPGLYKASGRNCGDFVQDALEAGKVKFRRTHFPNRLMDDVRKRYYLKQFNITPLL